MIGWKKSSSSDLSDNELSSEFKSGLTWRSLLAIFYSIFVFTPISIWVQLVTVGGPGLGGVISYFMLLVFAEYCRLSGKHLTFQEAAIIFGPASTSGIVFTGLIYRSYFMQSALPKMFGINLEDVPYWWAPPPEINALDLRTFYIQAWVAPLVLFFVTHYTSWAGGLFFGLLGRELFIENENLQFPIQAVTVSAIDTLTIRDERKIGIFTVTCFISLVYGILLYTVPTVTTKLRKPIRFLPVPWVDVSRDFQMYLPGTAFGVATDLMIFATGFILPERVVIGMLIGSVARFLVVNPLLIRLGLTEWAERWIAGMNVTRTYQESTLYFWINPLIGIGFAVGIVPVILRGKKFIQVFMKSLQIKRSTARRISGPPSSRLLLITLFLTGCVGAVIVDLWLIPDFPIWALILYEIIFPFMTLLMTGRIIGLTGQDVQLPYMNRLTILMSGHPRIDGWFLPLSLNPGTGWLTAFAICQKTKTTARSAILTNFIAWPFAALTGFLFTQLFWSIAPIPSILFPAPGIQWPVSIMQESLWITRPARFFHPDVMISSFLIYGGLMALFEKTGMPISMVGVFTGMSSPIPVPITIFIGYLVAKILTRIMGKEWFRSNRSVLAAGLMLGEGIAITFGIVGALAILSLRAESF